MTSSHTQTYRTHTAAELSAEQISTQVTLSGWVARRRDHGGVIFIDLRDASGYVQVVFREGEMAELAHALRSEFCVRVTGEVVRRPEGNENPEIPTGEIEITATSLTVLAASAPLPFPIDGHGAGEVGEETRLQYRYLDLRRPEAAAALRLRSQALRSARDVMYRHGFAEIETPDLTRSTPEGARDFIVPVRLQPGKWYALPQSPQLFKQLLMVAGMERYFQIARCFRDEDFRADRQPEFTQLDLEMSFVNREDVLAITEELIAEVWRETIGAQITTPFRRLTFREALDRFGSDKPDLRFDVELIECTQLFADTSFRVFQAEYVGTVVMPQGAQQSRKELDAWQEWARARGAKGLAFVLVQENGELAGPVAKNLSEAEKSVLPDAVGAAPGDAVFFAAGKRRPSQELLGAARTEIAQRCGLIDESRWEFAIVQDFPMFTEADDGSWTAEHHPFTSPTPEWVDAFEKDPGNALADAYDMVCNGSEIMSGSVRIHRSDLQQRVFDVIGLKEAEARSKFGFLLDAFEYGPPPHAGAAFGWDRISALLVGSDSIRDVIAFPKVASGGDPLTGAPTPITVSQRREAGIDAQPEE